MDWVHCNYCSSQPGSVDFYLTNCGHIYCSNCLKSGKLEKCIICSKSFTSIALKTPLDPSVEAYFMDPIDVINKQSKVLEFQQNHRIRLLAFNKKKLAKYEALKAENLVLQNKVSKMEKELRNAKKIIQKHERSIRTKINQSFTEFSPVMNNKENDYSGSQSMPDIGSKYQAYNTSILSSKRDPSSNFMLQRPPSSHQSNSPSTPTKNVFTPPLPPKATNSYRPKHDRHVTNSPLVQLSQRSYETPSSPHTPDVLSQIERYHRTVKLPGDKGGPSPCTQVGLHRLSIQGPRATSTPNSGKSQNLHTYSKYF